MEYTTLANLKEYLWIASTDYDTTLQKLITRCTQHDIFIVSNWPLTAITSIQEDDDSWDSVLYKRFDANIVYLEEDFDWTLYVVYVAWYSSLADIQDVEQACLEVCKDIWDNTPASWNEANIKSKKIETLSKTYFSKDEMAWGIWVDFRETLENYKTITPLIV